ncbi:MAG: type II toxin-antitoxin system HicB family antitoxin [Acidimicrobiia bacterium]
MTDHHINVWHSAEDGGYIAEIPDLPGCSAFGATPEEAVAEVVVAKQVWVESARSSGLPVPPPRYTPTPAG